MRNADILDRLRRNDARLESIQLQIQSGADTSAVVDALSQSTKLKRLTVLFFHLYTSPFQSETPSSIQQPNSGTRKRSRNEPSQPDLMQAIGALPQLQELTCCAGLAMHILPVSSLSALLQEASQLETLQLSRIQLHGSSSEFEHLINSIQSNTSLRSFSLEDCKLVLTLANPNTSQTTKPLSPPFVLDGILKALAGLPCLESVRVTTKDIFGMGILSPESLEVLCCSSSLQSLVLKGFAWNAQHIVALGPGVANSKNLKHLVLPKYLGLATPKIVDCLTFMLQNNACLEQFEMHTLGGSPWIHLAADILRTNIHLQKLTLGGSRGLPNDSIRFHLKLNQAGRSQLLSGTASSNREWVDAIGKVATDLDCIYYFMSQNPSLCD